MIAWASQQPTWAIGFGDEVWWSRFALPQMHAWQSQDQPVRLVEQPWRKDDPDPKALACYGVLWQHGAPDEPDRSQAWLRFVTGRPVSAITTQFLEWCCECLQKQGKTHWLLIWDNASWHKSQAVRTWTRQHNIELIGHPLCRTHGFPSYRGGSGLAAGECIPSPAKCPCHLGQASLLSSHPNADSPGRFQRWKCGVWYPEQRC